MSRVFFGVGKKDLAVVPCLEREEAFRGNFVKQKHQVKSPGRIERA